MKLLADTATDIFGTVKPPVTTIPTDATTAVGSLISLGVKLFIFASGMALLIYLLLGAFDWITSGGDKEKLSKAQGKIINAIVGILVVIVVLSIFCIVTVNILGISSSCFVFTLPQLGS